jgi:inosose dehydratase
MSDNAPQTIVNRAEPGILSVSVANAPCSWGIEEFPDWGPQLSYPDVLDQIRLAGYQGTELGPYGFLPTDPDLLRQVLAERSLQLVGAFHPVNFRDSGQVAHEMAKGLEVAALLQAIGCPRVIVADSGSADRPFGVERRPALDRAQWKQMALGLGQFAARCQEEYGLDVVFHPHVGTYVESPEELDALMEVLPPTVGLCLDTGHIVYGGGDPVEVARRYSSRVRHLHLKDIDRATVERVKRDGLTFRQAVRANIFRPLGAGDVDFSALFGFLQQSGYRGWAVVEQDRVFQSREVTLQDAIQSREYLRRLIGA